jgi:hypothetical protein
MPKEKQYTKQYKNTNIENKNRKQENKHKKNIK